MRRNAWRGGCCSPTLADGRGRSPGQPPRRGGSGLQKEPAVARSGGSLSSAPSVSWPFRAVPGDLRLRHASKHLKRYNYDLNHLYLRFLLAPDGHLPTEYFWHFWAFLPQMTFLPR